LIFILCHLTGYAQYKNFEKYDFYIEKAMLNLKDKNFKTAVNNFEKAFTILDDESADDYFYAAAAALNCNDFKKAEAFMRNAVVKTNAPKEYFLNFEALNKFRDNKVFSDVGDNYYAYQTHYLEQLKYPKIFLEIQNLCQRDQDARNSGLNYRTIDAQNISRLMKITKEHGWQKGAWLLLWHQRVTYEDINNPIWAYFKPLINDEIRRGKLEKTFGLDSKMRFR